MRPDCDDGDWSAAAARCASAASREQTERHAYANPDTMLRRQESQGLCECVWVRETERVE